MAKLTLISAQIPADLREAMNPVLDKEHITISEFLRLASEALVRQGKAPFPIPEESRGLARRRDFGKTFFG